MGENKEILVSIVVPVYQVKDTLRRCVLSCLNQKYLNDNELEVILVDDGSTDGSADICDELQKEDTAGRIKVLHTENHGVSHARNRGMEIASGRFVAFVDSDDEVSGSFLENLMKYADESTSLVDDTESYESSHKISGFQYIENSVLNKNTHVWGKLFNRKIIEESNIRFDENLTIGEDLIFLLDFAISQGRNHTIRCISKKGYFYTENAAGAMNSSFKPSYMDEIAAWRGAEERLDPYRTEISRYAFVSLSVSQIMTALLVVGKVAVLDEDKRNTDVTALAVKKAGEQIRHALKTNGTFAALSTGYKIKVMLFRMSPDLYLKLYNRHKKG